ncbi:ABC transporter ATP-binding protein [Haloarchaeobius sp. TZWSO28]|uniref:ABC transporter ATP-binding protein n=1 Tax=Haloarchaeobius sp. TZWSO28 TaxID=3446119 RepID=UPI003EC0F14C
MSADSPADPIDATERRPGEDPLLSIDSLEAGYETGQVLFGVDMEVYEGERVSLLGRNGAGKTTTMRSVIGTEVPDVRSGSIRFRGDELVGKAPYEVAASGVSLVPEDRRCFPALTVEENIQMAINHAPNPRGREEILESFPELQDMRTKHARNMSGGEQQMLAIARALASNPEMMLLDEPSEGLAPYIVRRIEDIITDINEEEGITVLFVEQNVGMAMAVADRHYILDEGHIVEEVTTDALREDEALRQRYLGV